MRKTSDDVVGQMRADQNSSLRPFLWGAEAHCHRPRGSWLVGDRPHQPNRAGPLGSAPKEA